jgi:hypothetical protein
MAYNQNIPFLYFSYSLPFLKNMMKNTAASAQLLLTTGSAASAALMSISNRN